MHWNWQETINNDISKQTFIMGIIIVMTLFFIGIMFFDFWYCRKMEIMKYISIGITLAILKTSLLFLLLMPKHGVIDQKDYLSALGAKTFIETEQILTQDDLDMFRLSIREINAYHRQRKDIKDRHERFWDGLFYSEKSLEKYPDISVKSMRIHKDIDSICE